jgi:carboxymethylenebutenolidase
MIETFVEIATPDGAMDTFICYPDRGGPYPPILFYMDAPAIREELRDMARRIASVGYHVTLPNLYYRTAQGLELDLAAMAQEGSAERKRMFELMNGLSIAKIMSDTKAMIAHTRADPHAAKGKMGAVGYCMSGPFVFAAAGHFPDDIGAAASIYGVNLCTDAPDSPHIWADKIKGEMYFACAETDQWAPLPMIEDLKKALTAAGTKAEVEIYPKTHHGFAFPKRAVFDKSAAERHWVRLFALFARNLR